MTPTQRAYIHEPSRLHLAIEGLEWALENELDDRKIDALQAELDACRARQRALSLFAAETLRG